MCRITYFTKRNQIKIEKSRFWKFNHENDANHDALKVICNIKLDDLKFDAFYVLKEISKIRIHTIYL